MMESYLEAVLVVLLHLQKLGFWPAPAASQAVAAEQQPPVDQCLRCMNCATCEDHAPTLPLLLRRLRALTLIFWWVLWRFPDLLVLGWWSCIWVAGNF
jgi:hypothetical protein